MAGLQRVERHQALNTQQYAKERGEKNEVQC